MSLEPALQTNKNRPSFVHKMEFCDLNGPFIPFPCVEYVKIESNVPSESLKYPTTSLFIESFVEVMTNDAGLKNSRPSFPQEKIKTRLKSRSRFFFILKV